jgi:hypothetical protein
MISSGNSSLFAQTSASCSAAESAICLLRESLGGVFDSLLAAQHALEMFRRELPHSTSRLRLDRLSNRLTKILTEARTLETP